jgi:uncharacterized protein (DUF885 family)
MTRTRTTVAIVICLSTVGCGLPNDPGDELHGLFDEAWEFTMREFPTYATSVGDHRFDDRLASASIEDEARRASFWRDVLARLETIDRSELGADDRINYDMFERELRDQLASFEFKEYLIPITNDSGFHSGYPFLADLTPLRTTKDFENYIARLNAIPRAIDQHIALMREGLAAGHVQPQVILEGYETTIAPHVVDDPSDSVFWRPFSNLPHSVPEADREALRQAGAEAIENGVIPAYGRFLEFMVDEYRPNARTSIGASELPNGRARYAWLVRHHTTLDLSPEQVHEIGLDEVTRIRTEMQEIIDEVGFEGGFAAFLEFLRTDPQFFESSPEDYIGKARDIAKRMDGKLPSLFKTLPRQPYGVEPVPDHLAPKYTTGRYYGAPLESTRAGTYWVNTYALESRPLWALTALTLHEAVPGHHLQGSLAKELGELPNFRRYSYVNAYGEGWGLYSEWLGIEAGMYDTPYERFGRLTYEMWRACRLVVDTGIHELGWSRQQAMDFMAANTALSRHEITTETDRYISWPGQALAYKMGEITIRRLRIEAKQALGERFDVREFHDVILLSGPVPLDVLEGRVRDWIDENTAGN